MEPCHIDFCWLEEKAVTNENVTESKEIHLLMLGKILVAKRRGSWVNVWKSIWYIYIWLFKLSLHAIFSSFFFSTVWWIMIFDCCRWLVGEAALRLGLVQMWKNNWMNMICLERHQLSFGVDFWTQVNQCRGKISSWAYGIALHVQSNSRSLFILGEFDFWYHCFSMILATPPKNYQYKINMFLIFPNSAIPNQNSKLRAML